MPSAKRCWRIWPKKLHGPRKRKHGNKRKRKKHHRNKNRRNFSSESNRGILNDNPPLISDSDRLGGGPNQVIEKKLSPVERVNNLMKQEASIRASSGGGSSSKSWNFLFSTLALFLLSSFVWWWSFAEGDFGDLPPSIAEEDDLRKQGKETF